MKRQSYQGKTRIVIEPGEYYVSNRDEILSTLLGSCVAACLYDPVNRVFGMNHFLLAYHQPLEGTKLLHSDAARYGMYAMELLINALLKRGANKANLRAKAFGGGNVLSLNRPGTQGGNIGEANSAFIRLFLQNEKIPLVASSLGGNIGRTIYFMPDDYSVYVKPIAAMKTEKLKTIEQRFLDKNLKEQQTSTSQIDYW